MVFTNARSTEHYGTNAMMNKRTPNPTRLDNLGVS